MGDKGKANGRRGKGWKCTKCQAEDNWATRCFCRVCNADAPLHVLRAAATARSVPRTASPPQPRGAWANGGPQDAKVAKLEKQLAEMWQKLKVAEAAQAGASEDPSSSSSEDEDLLLEEIKEVQAVVAACVDGSALHKTQLEHLNTLRARRAASKPLSVQQMGIQRKLAQAKKKCAKADEAVELARLFLEEEQKAAASAHQEVTALEKSLKDLHQLALADGGTGVGLAPSQTEALRAILPPGDDAMLQAVLATVAPKLPPPPVPAPAGGQSLSASGVDTAVPEGEMDVDEAKLTEELAQDPALEAAIRAAMAPPADGAEPADADGKRHVAIIAGAVAKRLKGGTGAVAMRGGRPVQQRR